MNKDEKVEIINAENGFIVTFSSYNEFTDRGGRKRRTYIDEKHWVFKGKEEAFAHARGLLDG